MPSAFLNNNRYESTFNFVKLDSKLNKNQIQSRKKEQNQKNVLTVYEKKLPNSKLINECNRIMELYKDHYNLHRKFSVFYHQESEDTDTKQQSKNRSNNQPLIKADKSKSVENFTFERKQSMLNRLKIMEPIKSNQYINAKGQLKIQLDQKIPPIKNSKLQSQIISSTLMISQNTFKPQNSLRTSSFLRIVALAKKRKSEEKKNSIESAQLIKNSSIISRERRKNLKIKFRKNILLIIEKLKTMKLTLSDIIEKDLFDKSTPYKFGEEIFHAIKEGNESMVFRIMMQKRVSIFTVDITQKSTLMWACIRGYAQIAELLLSNGVEPHWRDINDKTALYFSIKYNHIKCAKNIFLYAQYLEPGIGSFKMPEDMRKMVRIGISTHKFLNTFKNIEKKKEYFEKQYRYYFKD